MMYRGDPRLRENYSAAIPPNQSTSLFIKDLPSDITVVQILDRIRSTGKVYSLHINPPVPPPLRLRRQDQLLHPQSRREVLQQLPRRFLGARTPPRYRDLEQSACG